MFRRESLSRPFLLTSLLVLTVTVGLLVVVGGGKTPVTSSLGEHSQTLLQQHATAATPSTGLAATAPSVSSPVATAVMPTPVASPAATPAQATNDARILNPDELRSLQPNELGMIPILMYHMIVTEMPVDSDLDLTIFRTVDQFRGDLQMLYDNDFYLVPLRDVVNNAIHAPAGKHPVVLTFDDGTSGQFSFKLDDEGKLVLDAQGQPVPDPNSAVGILEAFTAEHPDFGHTAHFAPLIFNGFAVPDEAQEPYFEQKLHWLADHGYEIGNHTKGHDDLSNMTTDGFIESVAEPIAWMDDVLGDIPANQSRILTLPYGTQPDPDEHPDQWRMMRDGIPYDGEVYHLSAAILAWADPTFPPASISWNPLEVPRIKAVDASLDFWMDSFASGGTAVYTSDGNPDTITIPDPLSPSLEGTLDTDRLAATGKTVIRYNPETGEIASTTPPDAGLVAMEPVRSRRATGSGIPS